MQEAPAGFAERQSHEELSRQFLVMAQIEGERRVLALVPFAVAIIWLPVWLCLALALVNLAVESLGFAVLRRVAEAGWRKGYWLAMAGFASGQVTYMAIPALVWQDPDQYAKAFAVGVYAVNLTHLATVRSVHFPLALICVIPASLLALLAELVHWIGLGQMAGLVISTLCVAALTHFVLITMRTVHDLHRDLSRDRQAAEGANAAKTRFLAQMSHELRTPLNAIMGLGQAELAASQTPESRERLGTVVQSARSLSILLDDILDFSAVEAGAMPIRPSLVDLRAEIASTLALFRRQIAEAGLELDVSFDESLPALARADAQRLRQCLSNVLSNAVKYGGQGKLAVSAMMQPSALVVIEVTDSGPGVPPTLHEHIFEPFLRGDEIMPGTGLGLAISRRLARRMGGDLVLLPSATGARFCLTLQVEPAPPDAAPPPAPPRAVSLRGLRVMIVDDVATNRMVAASHLRLMGATAVECASGPEALTELAAERVDAVLLDMLMPEMDGIETLRAIRRLPGAVGQLPVLAMTADATEERRQACIEAGMDGYVTKPLTPEALGAALAKVLDLYNRPLPPA